MSQNLQVAMKVHAIEAVPRSVLIVDDEPPVRELMRAMVAQDGYAILTAKNANEALQLAEANRIDLLITDVDMPGMTGPELILALTARGLIERSLLVTGDLTAINQGDEWHCSVPFLAKPFNSRQLREMIRSLLDD